MAAWNTHLTSRCSALLAAFLLTLGGCGGESGSTPASTPSASVPSEPAASPPPAGTSPTETIENRITGSVGDGPIVNARLRVFANSGGLLAASTSSSTADYDLKIKTQGKNYPVTIRADQGVDLVTNLAPDFELLTAILSPSTRTISNVNPFSTLIFEAARFNGGINSTTVGEARLAVINRYGFGLDTELLADPVETPVNDANVHLIVKTSETLGEMIRRTRDAMLATGMNLHGDQVVASLAADLVDGWIDGYGAIQSNSRVAAVANVASAAVLIEAMSNQLLVYSVNSTRAMDQSIRQIRPSAPSSATTSNVAIPQLAFQQAIRGLLAAQVISSDPRIAATIEVMATAPAGALPADIAPRLPAGIHAVLRAATTEAAFASSATVDRINLQARSSNPLPPPTGGSNPKEPPPVEPPPETPPPAPGPGPANNPPVISGSPNTTLVVGSAWAFTPVASDADGDALTFSISGKPGWMSFNASTGQLTGSPSDAHVGAYPGIVISVTDGKATASLQAFTLTVTKPEPSTGSARISWTPPTEREDGTALTAIAGYRIYYSRNASQLDQVQNVSKEVTSFLVENLEQGTWYFAVTALCPSGSESAKSTVVSKTIN
jgi:hypothetical protein